MSNIDKREIHNQQLKAFITGFLSDPMHDDQSAKSMTAEVFRIALALLEAEKNAEPVAKVETVGVCWYADNGVPRKPAVGTELYTAQPAPVLVDEIAEQAGIDPDIANAYMQGVNDTNQRKLADIIPSAIPEGLTGQIVYLCAFDNMPRHELATRIWNACRDAIVHTELYVRSDCPWCNGEGYVDIDHGFEMGVEQKECRHCRAAMLQGKAEPVSQRDELQEGWVACSERMPEEGDDMIVFTDDIVMSGVSYSKKKSFYLQALGYDDDEPVDNVTHWMPLPSPPAK